MIKICVISDTHEAHRQLTLEQSDLLIHCGDATFYGDPDKFADFLEWFAEQPATHKLYVPGNHDMIFERNPSLVSSLLADHPSIRCLIGDEINLFGLHIYGEPSTIRCGRWAFGYPEGTGHLRWNKIPDDVELLITHQPPFGIMDKLDHVESIGCPELWGRVKQLKALKLHVFGHIHEGYGQLQIDDVRFINAALMDESYRLVNKPVYTEL